MICFNLNNWVKSDKQVWKFRIIFLFFIHKHIGKIKKRGTTMWKKPKWGKMSVSKTSKKKNNTLCFFWMWSCFHLLIAVSSVPPRGRGLISQGLHSQKPHNCFPSPFACRLFILSAARQQANFQASAFCSFPTSAKGSAASTSSRRLIHNLNERPGEPYLSLGTAGRFLFFYFFFL